MTLGLVLAGGVTAAGQQGLGNGFGQRTGTVAEPVTPAAQEFYDARSGLRFQVPAGWELTRKDHEVSTFAMDARSSGKATQLRAVAHITFNPYPAATFSGAYFYASVTPRVSDAGCARQAGAGVAGEKGAEAKPEGSVQVAGVTYSHGHDEHGGVCVESRDEIYTTLRKGGCYRFDLVVNSFCGGDVSGVRDMTAGQLDNVRKRLEGILGTVRFEP